MKRIKLRALNIFSKLRKKVLGKHSIGVVYQTENGILISSIEDVSVGRSLGFKGQWDIAVVNELLNYIDKNDTVYIIGTHIGTLLIPLAKHNIKVIGYEANPETFRYLKWNLQLNEIKDINIFNYAIGDRRKKVEFYKNKVNSGGSKIKPIKDSFLYTYDNPKSVEIDMLSLDEHVTQENLVKPNCIIMDIEGSEYFALKGMQNLLRDIKLLYIEYVPHHLENIANISNSEFLDLIVPYFETVRFTQNKKQFNLKNDYEEFKRYLKKMRETGASDDLLFTKTK